jgi:pre-mRNA-splicing factor CWC22
MGLKVVKERFADEEVKSACAGMFPLDNPKNTRFAINYFTSIGLGAITEEMREHLKVCNPCFNYKADLLIMIIRPERAKVNHGTKAGSGGRRVFIVRLRLRLGRFELKGVL